MYIHTLVALIFQLMYRTSRTILYTHPLHGEQLYLIILAFEKFLNILENSNSSLQISRGSLANYKTDNTNQESE